MKINKNSLEKKNNYHSNDDEKNHHGLSRRDLLKLVTVAGVGTACPIGQTLNFVLDSVISKAKAADTNAKNLICFAIDGGPLRFHWDNPLTPNGNSDLFMPGIMMNTRLTQDPDAPNGFRYEYKTTLKQGIYMPHIWDLEVPRANGGRRPIDELLNHMLIVRGVNMEIDSHPAGNAKIMAPLPGGVSVSGLVADEGKGYIPSVTIYPSNKTETNAGKSYKSPKGTGNIYVDTLSTNPLAGLLSAFSSDSKIASFRKNAAVKEKIDSAIDILHQWAKQNKHASDPVFNDRKKAEEMFRSTILSSGATDFEALRLKYKSICDALVKDAFEGKILGITDLNISGATFPMTVPGENQKFIKFGSTQTSESSYLTNQYNFEGHIVGNPDLKTMFKSAHFDKMARVFALCEFVIVKGLTNSFVTTLPFIENVFYERSPVCAGLTTSVGGLTQSNVNGNTVFNCNSFANGFKDFHADSHSTGSLISLILYTVTYMGYSACLLELIDQLKATPYNAADSSDTRTLFDETVIETASEFERITDATGAGSQHGPWGNTFSFLSGSLQKLTLIGNIRKGDTYPFGGTWGAGHKVMGVGGSGIADYIKATHIANTLCVLLRIKTITTAEIPLVYLDLNGKAQVHKDLTEPPKNLPDPK